MGAARTFIQVVLLSSLFVYSLVADALALEKVGFYDVCPGLLKTAKGFAEECVKSARSYEFNTYPHPWIFGWGEPEKKQRYAHFRTLNNGSHFGLGCTLDESHRINFLGIFYSTKSSNFAIANTAPIKYIADGEVALLGDGNKQINLDAIRQFSIDSRSRPFRPYAKSDCEPADYPDGHLDAGVPKIYIISERQLESGNEMIKWSFSAHTRTESPPLYHRHVEEYVHLLTRRDQRKIYYTNPIFITAGGGIVVPKKVYEQACPGARNADYIWKEVCDFPPPLNRPLP